jgi:teichuronic acid biosynthesis glycosyltransferase TuaC
MRVLFVTNLWPSDDAPWRGACIRAQADSLRALGVELDVFTIDGFVRRRAYLSAVPQIMRLARSRNYDVVHAHYGHSAVIARIQLETPLVISYLGSDLLGRVSRRAQVEARAFRQLARVAAATITMSAEMERCLPPSARSRNAIIPNGVDLEMFQPQSRAEARAALGWPAETRVLLFAAQPTGPKGFPIAQAVLELLRGQGYPVALRVAERVPHEDMPRWMNAADVLLFPSRSEGSPNVVKEAMACATPIVATPVGDVPELLAGVDGCFVTTPEPAAMADAVTKAFSFERAPAARAALSPLSLEAVGRRVLALYESVAIASSAAGRHRLRYPSSNVCSERSQTRDGARANARARSSSRRV